jgi:alpha-glucosidase
LPEYIDMPDEARQDPTWRRSGYRSRGRDGCRVPLPWEAEAPAYGFSPTDRTWLPQPAFWADYALDRQRGVPGSTYEMYRSALRHRKERRLGAGSLEWVDLGADAVAFRNGDMLVVTNLGRRPVPLPAAAQPILASAEITDNTVGTDVTVWAVDR